MKIGLTGGIATGKSTVSKILIKNGFKVIDADAISKEVITLPDIIEKIKNFFGENVISENKVNRRKLREIVFNDKKKLEILNSIMHPVILKRIKEELTLWTISEDICIFDIPLLFELNLEKEFDKVVLVYSPKKIQLERLIKRDNISLEEAKITILNQLDIEEKKNRADYIIYNEGTIEELENNVKNVFSNILNSKNMP